MKQKTKPKSNLKEIKEELKFSKLNSEDWKKQYIKLQKQIKTFYEFYLRYKDKPELLLKEQDQKLSSYDKEEVIFYSKMMNKSLESKDGAGIECWKKIFNEWLLLTIFQNLLTFKLKEYLEEEE